MLAWLTGCQKEAAHGVTESDRLMENPPPKPPNCPELPELENVKSGGKIIDVRIIQVSGKNLYIPASWFGKFPDSYRYKGRMRDSALGIYSPDINAIECPGVVHRFVSERHIFDISFVMVSSKVNSPVYNNPNVSSESSIERISIARPRGVTDRTVATSSMFEEGIIDWPTERSPSARIVLLPNLLVATYPWSKTDAVGSPRWIGARASVIELGEWLMTPPKGRDNERKFNLGSAEK